MQHSLASRGMFNGLAVLRALREGTLPSRACQPSRGFGFRRKDRHEALVVNVDQRIQKGFEIAH